MVHRYKFGVFERGGNVSKSVSPNVRDSDSLLRCVWGDPPQRAPPIVVLLKRLQVIHYCSPDCKTIARDFIPLPTGSDLHQRLLISSCQRPWLLVGLDFTVACTKPQNYYPACSALLNLNRRLSNRIKCFASKD